MDQMNRGMIDVSMHMSRWHGSFFLTMFQIPFALLVKEIA